MRVFFILSLCVVYSQAISYQDLIEEQWENFKLEHDKIYPSETEEQYRLGVYLENLQKVNKHNQLYEMGLTSYKMALNKFGDLPEEEFLRLYTMQNLNIQENLPQSMQDFVIFAPLSTVNLTELPGAIDWRDKGAVTPVKDQGQCGSCWSFSATGVLEGQWYKKTSKLISMSEQNLMDCSWRYGNHGCGGGWAHKALNYIRDNRGIDTEASYPYRRKSTRKCKYSSQNKVATVSKVVMVPRGENQLLSKVAFIGPMAVNIEVSYGFHLYGGGVYDEPRCRGWTNHAVLAVGYGSKGGKDYWLVKNSWGRNWGEDGYILMSRNKKNQCGIASEASYPVV